MVVFVTASATQPPKVASYDAPILEAWAAWELFRRMGFSSDDLAFAVNAIGEVCIVLKAQGKQFSVAVALVGPGDAVADRLIEQWHRFSETLQVAPEQELQTIWDRSLARQRTGETLVLMRAKGFVIPRLVN